MDEKAKELAKKLQALAERGVGGEKATAEKKLQALLKKNGIASLEELEEDKTEYYLFSYNGRHEIALLKQCFYKVLGYKADRTTYRTTGTRQKLGIYCTPAQKIEIELEFEFYRNVFYSELQGFMSAFIQAQDIFPQDAPHSDWNKLDEKQLKIMAMAQGIDKRTRAVMIEEKGGK